MNEDPDNVLFIKLMQTMLFIHQIICFQALGEFLKLKNIYPGSFELLQGSIYFIVEFTIFYLLLYLHSKTFFNMLHS